MQTGKFPRLILFAQVSSVGAGTAAVGPGTPAPFSARVPLANSSIIFLLKSRDVVGLAAGD